MAERFGSLIAVSLGVLCAAAADRIEDDEDGAGHPRPATVLRTVPLLRGGRSTRRWRSSPAKRGDHATCEGASIAAHWLPRSSVASWRRRRRTTPSCSHSGRAEYIPRFAALDHLAAPHDDDVARERPHDP